MEAKYFFLCLEAAIAKIPRNLIMCGGTLAVCMVLGLVIALIRTYRVPVLAPVLDVLMAVTKAFPANLVLLICFMAYMYSFSSIAAFFRLKITIRDVDMIYIAMVGLVIITLPGISEMLRSGLLAIPRGQFEAGYAVGMTPLQTFRDIILPQVLAVSIPNLTNLTLSLMKATALVSVIGVSDILKGAQDAATMAYCFLEAYAAAALVFWGLGALIEQVGSRLEKHFARTTRYIK